MVFLCSLDARKGCFCVDAETLCFHYACFTFLVLTHQQHPSIQLYMPQEHFVFSLLEHSFLPHVLLPLLTVLLLPHLSLVRQIFSSRIARAASLSLSLSLSLCLSHYLRDQSTWLSLLYVHCIDTTHDWAIWEFFTSTLYAKQALGIRRLAPYDLLEDNVYIT